MSKSLITAGSGSGGGIAYCAKFLKSNWVFVRDTSKDGYWKWEKFSSITCDSTTKDKLKSLTPTVTNYYQDSTISITMNIDNSYTARCTIYCDCKAAFSTTLTCSTDDAGYVYLNEQPLGAIASCANVNFTFNFVKGINKIEFYYTEGSGGDGWLTNPHLQTMVGTNFNWICGEGYFEQTVSLKPKPRNNGIYIIKTTPQSSADKSNKDLLYNSELYISSTGGDITAYPKTEPTADTEVFFGGGVENSNILKCDLLFGGGTTWAANSTNLPLAHPYTDYDLIAFTYCNSGESMQNPSSSYLDSKIYPVEFLKDAERTGSGIALFGYSTRFVKYSVSSNQFTWIRNGDSGTTGVTAIYGIKCTPN